MQQTPRSAGASGQNAHRDRMQDTMLRETIRTRPLFTRQRNNVRVCCQARIVGYIPTRQLDYPGCCSLSVYTVGAYIADVYSRQQKGIIIAVALPIAAQS